MADKNKSASHVSIVDVEVPCDDTSSSSAPMFEIEVKATFIILEKNTGTGDEMFVEAGRIISHVIHEFRMEDLINDGNGAVSDMLDSMRVPVQPSMVEEIAVCAVRLVTAARYRNSKVLRMKVEIEAAVDDVPDFGTDDDTDGDDNDDDEGPVKAEEVAENVGKVVVEGTGKDCPICLEELVVGFEAACMPCSHVFHDHCIMTWLNRKKRCPCCRFKLTG